MASSNNGGIIGVKNTTTLGGPISEITEIFTTPGSFTQTEGAPGDLNVLIVGGGGGAGQRKAGGGGAGGVRNFAASPFPTAAIPVTVGAGGAGGTVPGD